MSKWKCVELGNTCGFTEGRIYEVESDGIIYYDSGNKSSEKLSINGNKAKCWQAKFEKVEEKKDMDKFKIGDMIKGKTGSKKRYAITNEYMTKGEVIGVNDDDEIKVKVLEHSTDKNTIGDVWWVDKELFELATPSKKSIHISFDGETTHAIVKEDGKVVRREKVGLFKGDVYDEATGVREVINKLYGKRVVEDVKPKFVKAKVGDTIKIVKGGVRHTPSIKVGDTFIVKSVSKNYVESKHNGFLDKGEEYIIIPSKSFSIGDKVKLLDGKGKGYSFVGGWAFGMSEEVGKIATVKEVREDGKSVLLNEVRYVWDIDCLELVKPSQISEYTTDELLSEIKKRMEE